MPFIRFEFPTNCRILDGFPRGRRQEGGVGGVNQTIVVGKRDVVGKCG